MAPQSSIQFLDMALDSNSRFSLSYTDPDQRWLIRKHLLSLLHEFPALKLSFDTFIHNDGTNVNLLYAGGVIRVSSSTPLIPLTVWIHQDYPHLPPIVYISPDRTNLIHPDHPFVDQSGSVMCPYLITWVFPESNLLDLTRNLVKLFAQDHPFFCSSPYISFGHPSMVSKMEALDRLVGSIHYDMKAHQAQFEEDMENLSVAQIEMVERVDVATSILIGLDNERCGLKNRVKEWTEKADVMMNWLKVNNTKVDEMRDGFEGADEVSKMVISRLAKDKAVEDLMYALDKALEEGIVTFEVYIRSVSYRKFPNKREKGKATIFYDLVFFTLNKVLSTSNCTTTSNSSFRRANSSRNYPERLRYQSK